MKKILCISLLSLMTGCTTYHYDVFNENGTPKESFSYTRPLGRKDVKGLYFYGDAQGKRILKIESVKSDEEKLIELLTSAVELGKKLGAASAGVPLP